MLGGTLRVFFDTIMVSLQHLLLNQKSSITIRNIDFLAYAICVYTLVMLLLL